MYNYILAWILEQFLICLDHIIFSNVMTIHLFFAENMDDLGVRVCNSCLIKQLLQQMDKVNYLKLKKQKRQPEKQWRDNIQGVENLCFNEL